MKKHQTTIISLLILASAVSCINITIDKTQIKDGMHTDYQPPSSVQLRNTFSYSADQVAMQQEFGSPTRFMVIFGENNRLETWYYDTKGYTSVFMNGTKISEKHSMPQYPGTDVRHLIFTEPILSRDGGQ